VSDAFMLVDPMTKVRLRKLIFDHVRQPYRRRDPGHRVVAIYLGREQWMSMMSERNTGSDHAITPRDGGGFLFDGVPVHYVGEMDHIRIVSEYVER
jgi:hypothetical protein